MIPVKICGITRLEDALHAVELGASAIGFVFYPKSARCIVADDASMISAQLPAGVARIGVFVNPDPDSLHVTAEMAGLTHVQLHGDEPPELEEFVSLPVIKALRPPYSYTTDTLTKFGAVAFLIDGGREQEYGGTGQLADWKFAKSIRENFVTILAGGISSQNVAQAVTAAQPDALDLSSSVEERPGIKDHRKLRRFFETVRELEYDGSRLEKGFTSLSL